MTFPALASLPFPRLLRYNRRFVFSAIVGS